MFFFFFSSRRRHTRFSRDWSSDVCSSDLRLQPKLIVGAEGMQGSDPSALPTPGLLQALGEFLQGGVVVHLCQSFQIALIDLLADLSPAVKVGQTPTQHPPLLGTFRISFFAPINPEFF